MKSLVTSGLILLFVILSASCFSHLPGGANPDGTPLNHPAAFCTVLHASGVSAVPLSQLPLMLSRETVRAGSDLDPICSMSRTVYHPPEQLG